jgi:hypothetical protein
MPDLEQIEFCPYANHANRAPREILQQLVVLTFAEMEIDLSDRLCRLGPHLVTPLPLVDQMMAPGIAPVQAPTAG